MPVTSRGSCRWLPPILEAISLCGLLCQAGLATAMLAAVVAELGLQLRSANQVSPLLAMQQLKCLPLPQHGMLPGHSTITGRYKSMLLLLPFSRTAICNHRTPVVQHCSAMSWGLLLLKLRRRSLESGSLWPLRLPICPRTRCERPHLICRALCQACCRAPWRCALF